MGDTASPLLRMVWRAPQRKNHSTKRSRDEQRNEEIRKAEEVSLTKERLRELAKLAAREKSYYTEPRNATFAYLQPSTPENVRIKIAREIVNQPRKNNKLTRNRNNKLRSSIRAYEEKKDRNSEDMQALLKQAVALRIQLVNSQTNSERAELEIESEEIFKKIADLQKELYSEGGGKPRGHRSQTRRSARSSRRTPRNRLSSRRV
jgi:hypothetical protein